MFSILIRGKGFLISRSFFTPWRFFIAFGSSSAFLPQEEQFFNFVFSLFTAQGHALTCQTTDFEKPHISLSGRSPWNLKQLFLFSWLKKLGCPTWYLFALIPAWGGGPRFEGKNISFLFFFFFPFFAAPNKKTRSRGLLPINQNSLIVNVIQEFHSFLLSGFFFDFYFCLPGDKLNLEGRHDWATLFFFWPVKFFFFFSLFLSGRFIGAPPLFHCMFSKGFPVVGGQILLLRWRALGDFANDREK